jgi:acetyl-CoA acetyltransferase/uncharacterized OB-fold protein
MSSAESNAAAIAGRPTSRPLPQPTLASDAFWASGADGVLRIAGCESCKGLHHPPQPVCPHCGSFEVSMVEVSGKAVVAGVTVNHQQWLPHFPPPYVIAIVAIAEDDRARLTTNLVNVAPEDVSVGMRVRVLFEHDEEVWVPLFEPDPDTDGTPGPIPEPRNYGAALRPMATTTKFEDKVCISGIGMSEVGRRLMRNPISLTVDAALQAVADAGLRIEDIDGLSTFPGPVPNGMSEGGVTALSEALQLRPTWVNGAAETPGQNGSIMTAMLAVAAGLCRHVLCFRTVWEGSHQQLTRSGDWKPATGRAVGMAEWRAPFGAMSAANWIACNASHYMHRYGVGREVMGLIAINERTMAARNPIAIYQDPITMDDYLSARMVSSPFGLLDCDVPCDGSVAVIVSAIETAPDLPKPPVLVEAVGTQIMERVSWDQDTLTHMPQSLGPAKHLWSRTSLTTADVDLAQLYDGFTFNAISWMEGLGFCEFGGAYDYLDGGRTIALDGDLPLNTSGGQLSAGRLHGYGFMHEAVLQLRGEATGRQVADPKVAVVSAGGGIPSGVMLLRTAD